MRPVLRFRCSFCHLLQENLRSYVSHIKYHHGSYINIVCPVDLCCRSFTKHDTFYRHVKNDHKALYECHNNIEEVTYGCHGDVDLNVEQDGELSDNTVDIEDHEVEETVTTPPKVF